MKSEMIRIDIVLDSKLLEAGLRATCLKTRRGLVDFALRELLRHKQQKKLLARKRQSNLGGGFYRDAYRTRSVILVDTSVWIDFFAGRDLPHVATLERLISENEDLALCGIIMSEILQGIADDTTHRRVRRFLGPLIMMPMPDTVLVRAATIYRKLLKQGVTIRETNDCIIAATVLKHHGRLLHNDKDFVRIAKHYPLKFVKP